MEDEINQEPAAPEIETVSEYAYPLGPILDGLVRAPGTSNYTYGKDLTAAIEGYTAFRAAADRSGQGASFEEILSRLKPTGCATLIDFLTLNKSPNERWDSLSGILGRRQGEYSKEKIEEIRQGMDRVTIDQMPSPGEGVLRRALANSLNNELTNLEANRSYSTVQGRVLRERYAKLMPRLTATPPK